VEWSGAHSASRFCTAFPASAHSGRYIDQAGLLVQEGFIWGLCAWELCIRPDICEELRQFQTFGIFAAGYLARPLGGVLMGHAGDLRGRKRMFTLSIFLMALPTLGIGLLPTYATLGIGAPILLLHLRILQGVAVGGEVPGAWVFVSEHVSQSQVGLACGILTGGLTGGILLGSLVVILLTPALLQKVYGVPAVVALRANSLASLALAGGCVLAGRLTDWAPAVF
jgi:MFS family permease